MKRKKPNQAEAGDVYAKLRPPPDSVDPKLFRLVRSGSDPYLTYLKVDILVYASIEKRTSKNIIH
jgi:hypothetical protein